MTEHRLAKRTISALLRANGVTMRHQGLTDNQGREAADLYVAGRSLVWIADYVGGFSPTPVAGRSRGKVSHFARARAFRERCCFVASAVTASAKRSRSLSGASCRIARKSLAAIAGMVTNTVAVRRGWRDPRLMRTNC
jgi:hypothetical protein